MALNNPNWHFCQYCNIDLTTTRLSLRSEEQIQRPETIDLTNHDSPIQHRPISTTSTALTIPRIRQPSTAEQLSTAIHTGNQVRSDNARATRKHTLHPVFDLTISLFTAAYTVSDQDGLPINKVQSTYPQLARKITNCIVTDPRRIYHTHGEMISDLVAMVEDNPAFLQAQWKLISGCSSGIASSISWYPRNVYNTTSLVELCTSANLAISPPYKYTILLLYMFKKEEEWDDPITPLIERKRKAPRLSASPIKAPGLTKGKGKAVKEELLSLPEEPKSIKAKAIKEEIDYKAKKTPGKQNLSTQISDDIFLSDSEKVEPEIQATEQEGVGTNRTLTMNTRFKGQKK